MARPKPSHPVGTAAHIEQWDMEQAGLLTLVTRGGRRFRVVDHEVERDGLLVGENTDGQGFVEALRPVCTIEGQRVLLFGAGGAARAVAVELALAGAAHITVINRGRLRGQDRRHRRIPALAADHADSHGHRHRGQRYLHRPVPECGRPARHRLEHPAPRHVVADAIPNPPRTHLIRTAEAAGCTVLDGLGMLVNQGAVAIRLWSGVDVDRGVMRRELERALGVAE